MRMNSGKRSEGVGSWLSAALLAVSMAAGAGYAQEQPADEKEPSTPSVQPSAQPMPPPAAVPAASEETSQQEEAPSPLRLDTPQEAPAPQLETPQPSAEEGPAAPVVEALARAG